MDDEQLKDEVYEAAKSYYDEVLADPVAPPQIRTIALLMQAVCKGDFDSDDLNDWARKDLFALLWLGTAFTTIGNKFWAMGRHQVERACEEWVEGEPFDLL